MSQSCCFVLSPGRCGTQWLAQILRKQLDGVFRVEHEPIHFGYLPTKNSPKFPLRANEEIITAHLESIKTTLKSGMGYAETGFPNWRHLSWLRQQLQTNGITVKVIHITRPIVENAQSLLKLKAFMPPFFPHEITKNFMDPNCPETVLNGIGKIWLELNPLEKCMLYCAEVHAQANIYRNDIKNEHWMAIEFNDLFLPETVERIMQFLGAEFEDALFSDSIVDCFGKGIVPSDPAKLHPKVKDIVFGSQRIL